MSQKVYFPNLSKTRKAKGYTQSEMTEILHHKSPSRYAMYETGDRKPQLLEALRIAEILEETVEYLFVTEVKRKANAGVSK